MPPLPSRADSRSQGAARVPLPCAIPFGETYHSAPPVTVAAVTKTATARAVRSTDLNEEGKINMRITSRTRFRRVGTAHWDAARFWWAVPTLHRLHRFHSPHGFFYFL